MTTRTVGQIRSDIAIRAAGMSRAALQYKTQTADQDTAEALEVVKAAARRRKARKGGGATLAELDIARAYVDAAIIAGEWRYAAEQRDSERRAVA
ncbi:hypothetical protein ACFRCG_41650 [Embleya sp. NPDC056575]|uniref:hypothetical protein n=1 Tax=unclassified Embleya TaxID=2699296 RepID=UPI003679E3C0